MSLLFWHLSRKSNERLERAFAHIEALPAHHVPSTRDKWSGPAEGHVVIVL